MKQVLFLLACSFLMMPHLLFSQDVNEATEPSVQGPGAIDLLKGGTLEAWYARLSLRISADSAIINQIYNSDKWNRMTIRARGNRLEYWINGIKVMDYRDQDPKGSHEGVIGFQMHDGSVMKIEYRNIRVLPLAPKDEM